MIHMRRIRKMSVVLMMIVGLISSNCGVATADNLDKLRRQVCFLSIPQEVAFDNGLVAKIESAWIGWIYGKSGGQFYNTSQGLLNISYTITVEGVNIRISNPSSKVAIVKWSESALTIGSFSGMPFIGGMKYRDAGNPSATPDLIVAPGQTITKDLYVSRVHFDKDWSIDGEPLRKDNTTTATLVLKVLNDKGGFAYYTIVSPQIGIPSSPANPGK